MLHIEDCKWSEWIIFNDEVTLSKLPKNPGIYEVRTDFEIGRLNGSSSTVTIGRAKNLQERRAKQKAGDLVRYLNRAEKWLYNSNHKLEFRYCMCDSFEDAKLLEALKLWEYESLHWELPPGNDRLEKPPILNKINRVYDSTDRLISDIEAGRISIEEASHKSDLPQIIITNLLTYWGNKK